MNGLLIIVEYFCFQNASLDFNNTVDFNTTNFSTITPNNFYDSTTYLFDTDSPCLQPALSVCRTLESTECSGDLLMCVTSVPEDENNNATCSACDPGFYGSSIDNCSACTPGFHSPDPGTTSCLECAVGEFTPLQAAASCDDCPAGAYAADPGSTACVFCTDGVDFATLTNCTNCTTECPVAHELNGTCTAANDYFCKPCTPVSNCVHYGACGNSSTPNCECVAGFEMVDGECRVCQTGFFKNQTSFLPCQEWDTDMCAEGYYAVNGTRFHNSVCLPCPDIPDNATFTGVECEWGCDAGFNNTVESFLE